MYLRDFVAIGRYPLHKFEKSDTFSVVAAATEQTLLLVTIKSGILHQIEKLHAGVGVENLAPISRHYTNHQTNLI